LVVVHAGNIQDFYEQRRSLGEGAFGKVCRATCKKTGIQRAVKTVVKKSIKDVQAFQREIEITRNMDHPNIIKLFETFEDHRSIYLVMELCEGGELFDRLVELGHLTEAQAAMLVQQICRALCYVHGHGVCHRDLKPENFLFAAKGPMEGSPLKLIDFGFSRCFEPGEVLHTALGTPDYVAPEVLSKAYGTPCDLWSCGVIAYCILCGKPPFCGRTDNAVLAAVRSGRYSMDGPAWEHISEDAKDLVRSLLQLDPSARPTAAQVLEHEWIKHLAPRSAGTALGLHIIENLKSFRRHSQFKKAALVAIAGQMNESEIRDLTEAFTSIDTDGSGTITIGEMHDALVRAELALPEDLREIMDGMDLEGRGEVDYSEFLAASLDKRLYAHEDACWHAFRAFDRDGNGQITLEELKAVLEHEDLQHVPGAAELRDTIHEVDTNDDGMVEFSEFMRMIVSIQAGGQRTVSGLLTS